MQKSKIISSLAYKFTEQFFAKGLGFIISVILARLLSPNDFGQIAILTIFINLSQTIIQSGLNTALVQSKKVSAVDYSTVFYISLFLSIILIIALYFFAPLIASFYNSGNIVSPLRFYSLSLILGAFNSIQVAKMQREMQFRSVMIARIIATVLSGIIGIWFAYAGKGLWALVYYNFSNILFSCVTMLMFSRWLPRFLFSYSSAKRLFGYGWKMLVSALLCSLYNDIRSLIIGKKHSTEDLGYYNRGQQIPNITSTTIDLAVQSVMLSVIARYQDDKVRVRDMLSRSLTLSSLFIFPLMIGFALVARPVVLLLFTEKWLPAVYFMQIICIAEAHIPLTSSNLTTIKAIGRSDVYMKLELVRRIVMLAILLVSVFCFGSLEAIVIGYAISSWVDVVIVMLPMKKLLGYGIISQFKDLSKIIISTLIMGVAVYLFSLINLPMIILLILQIIIGVLIYCGCCFVLREKSFNYAISAVKSFLSRKKNVSESKSEQVETDGKNGDE